MKRERKYLPDLPPCGCGVMGVKGLGEFVYRVRYKHLHVHFCPLHEAAPGLLQLLKTLELNIQHDTFIDPIKREVYLGFIRPYTTKFKGST